MPGPRGRGVVVRVVVRVGSVVRGGELGLAARGSWRKRSWRGCGRRVCARVRLARGLGGGLGAVSERVLIPGTERRAGTAPGSLAGGFEAARGAELGSGRHGGDVGLPGVVSRGSARGGRRVGAGATGGGATHHRARGDVPKTWAKRQKTSPRSIEGSVRGEARARVLVRGLARDVRSMCPDVSSRSRGGRQTCVHEEDGVSRVGDSETAKGELNKTRARHVTVARIFVRSSENNFDAPRAKKKTFLLNFFPRVMRTVRGVPR